MSGGEWVGLAEEGIILGKDPMLKSQPGSSWKDRLQLDVP